MPSIIRSARPLLLLVMFAVLLNSQSPSSPKTPEPAAAQAKPDTNDQPGAAQDAAAAGSPSEALKESQIEADTRKLHLLAAELRTEVGRTYKESLSVSVLKKAEEVEKLARSLRERMSKVAATRH